MSNAAFRRIQIGQESTRGTLVAATKRLVGTITMTPEINWHRPMEDRNSLAEFFRSVVVGQGTRLRFEGDASYDQIIDFLAMALKGGVTAVQQGATAAYKWTYLPNLTAVNTPDSYTIEFGDNTQEFECGFVVVENLELAVALGEVVVLRADMFGKLAAKATFTASLINPTNFEEIVANNLKVYIDTTYAGLGTTEKSSLVTGATIRLATGLSPVKYANGGLEMDSVSEAKRHLELELEMVMGSAFVTEYDAYIAGTARAIRLEFTGSEIATPYNHLLTVDVFGKYTSPPELFGERDGEDIVRLTLASHEDGLATPKEFEIGVINQETAY